MTGPLLFPVVPLVTRTMPVVPLVDSSQMPWWFRADRTEPAKEPPK